MNSHRGIRASDADRSRVADLLDVAYSDGRLTAEEHEDRISTALVAKTHGDLVDLIVDPGPTSSSDLFPAVGGTESSPHAVTLSSAPPTVESISSFFSDTTRGRGHVLAPRVAILGGLSDIRLDLSSSALSSPQTTLAVSLMASDLIILAPEGIRVNPCVNTILGDLKIRGLAPAPDTAPTLTITGHAVLAYILVYGPEHRKFARYRKRWNR